MSAGTGRMFNNLLSPWSRKVAREYWDADGATYWIELRPGWQRDDEHAIAESSKLAARARLKDVRACNCADCCVALDNII